MRFLGIDFGWNNKPSGVAVLAWDGSALELTNLERLTDPADIVQWVDSHAGKDAVVGIDAPIVIPNATGMRVADRLAQAMYRKFHAGAYPASRARSFWQRTTGFSKDLLKLGFTHGDEQGLRSTGRFQIEVHPHAASVQLFALNRIIKYKRGSVLERAKQLRVMRKLLLDRLPRLVPPAKFESLPKIPNTGAALKAVEDQLDAVLCAYIAAHWWYWGRERNDVLGNSKRGYIVVPRRQTPDLKLADLREEYRDEALEDQQLEADPLMQFQKWFNAALRSGVSEPNAMTVATAATDGQPSARIVLLKEVTEAGFVFYTNYRSRKGRELAENPRAALVFFWKELNRQVRITGSVVKTSRQDSEAYFASRPRGSQLAAWASWQSSPIADREVLDKRLQRLEEKYAGSNLPLPPSWGGFRLKPDTIEFWQGRPNRLHDRFLYSKSGKGNWKKERLAP